MRSRSRCVVVTAVFALAMAGCGGGSSPPPAPTVTLTSSATDVAVHSVVTLTWSSTNATACTPPVGEPGMTVGPAGAQSVAVARTSTYTISCSGRGGVATASVTVNVWYPPDVSITADRTSVFPNTAVLLTWSATNATTCRGVAGLSGTLPTAGSQTSAPLTETTTFTIECSNPWGRAANSTVVTVALPKFAVLELPMDKAVDLNDAGDVVGERQSVGGLSEAVVRTAEGRIEVLGCSDQPRCYDIYHPVAMNSTRTVIGRRYNVLFPNMHRHFRWHVGDGVEDFVHIAYPADITDINDAGQIVGGGPGPGAMLYSDDLVVLLFGSSGSVSVASAINDAGHVTGYSVPNADRIRHVFLYADGAVQDLGTLDGASSDAQDINLADEIVGSAATPAGVRAFRYANSKFTDLGSLGGTSSWANSINDTGRVVGWSTLAGDVPQQQHAFLYLNDRMYDLNDLVGPLPMTLSLAIRINNRGQVLAGGCVPATNDDCRYYYYLLTPVTSP